MTREEVELKVVEYAKSVDWDFEKVYKEIYHMYCLVPKSEWEMLIGDNTTEKAQYILNKYKPKMKYTIEDLRNGNVAVMNDGTEDELRDLLKIAFGDGETSASHKYYYAIDRICWGCDDECSLPAQSVKDFLVVEDNFKNGDAVEVFILKYWDSGYTYIGKDGRAHVVKFNNLKTYSRMHISEIRKPIKKIVLTRSEIAEKFGISIDELEIKD